MARRGGVVRGGFLVTAGLAFAIASACATSPADEAPVLLPERVPSSDGGDAAGREGGPGGDAALVDAASAACTNGKKDGDETDVDCGGPACAPCANGRACVLNRDCGSVACSGGKCNADLGCADGTREGFTPVASFANIAACAGAWSVPGLVAPGTRLLGCARGSGNDSVNATGAGCTVADLCQLGWHVCESVAEVASKSAGAGCAPAAKAGLFFVTRQSGPGAAQCGVGTNDLFGCGGAGGAPDPTSCAPLDRFSGDLCASLGAGWSCGADGLAEANNVTNTNSATGGALCCRD
jgi:hypothetical protein